MDLLNDVKDASKDRAKCAVEALNLRARIHVPNALDATAPTRAELASGSEQKSVTWHRYCGLATGYDKTEHESTFEIGRAHV